MYLRIISTSLPFIPQLSFNFLLSSNHGSNPSWYRHHRLPCLPCHCLIFPQIFFYFLNKTYKETPLQVEVHEIIFQMSHHSHERGSEQESCAYFTPVMQYVQSWFQVAQRSMCMPYLLIWVFKIDDPWCVRKRVWRIFWILSFLPMYISEHYWYFLTSPLWRRIAWA
jgi:hypothetical protein